MIQDFQIELLELLWDVVYKETSWGRTGADLDAAVMNHKDQFLDLARRVVKHLGKIPDDGVLIPDHDDYWCDGGDLCYNPGELLVSFRANCEDDWVHTVEIPVSEADLYD